MSERFTWTSERIGEVVAPSERAGPRHRYTGVSTDTRTVQSGELFVALRGDRYDAHEFVADAARAGALGAVVERAPEGLPGEFELFVVEDALLALGRLATQRRRALNPSVLAITGTSGKTTTKALTGAALGDETFTSPGNLNNLVGVPLSMLKAPEGAAIWVLELASNQPGEIGRLARIAEPDHAIVTSVAEGHLEGFGDLQGVLEEKLGVLEPLPDEGYAFVADEPAVLADAARGRHARVVTVGLGEAADERPDSWSSTESGVEWTWAGARFQLPSYGSHMVRNGLFAAVAARQLGMAPDEAARRLQRAKLPAMRGEVRRLNGMTLLVDCYNANPSSFRAALDALAALAAGRRRVVVAGTMLELGRESAELHRRVAGWMVEGGIELVAAVGAFADAFEGLGGGGVTEVIRAGELEEAYRRLAGRLKGSEAVLIKASRGMRFERAVEMLERDFGGEGRVARSETGER